jgi:predicted glutamine amidotransferase
MCIACYNNKHSVLDEQTLNNMISNNPDSFGLIWVDNNKLQTFKTLDSNEFKKKYYKIKEKLKTEVILHCRIATSGQIDLINCHPFNIDENLAFVHNGIMHEFDKRDKKHSDTYHLNELFKTLPAGFLNNNGIVELITKVCDYDNKLIFMDNYSNVTIINEKEGHWDNGNWFSNKTYSYKKPKKSKYQNQHGLLCWFCGSLLITPEELAEGECSLCREEREIQEEEEFCKSCGCDLISQNEIMLRECTYCYLGKK